MGVTDFHWELYDRSGNHLAIFTCPFAVRNFVSALKPYAPTAVDQFRIVRRDPETHDEIRVLPDAL